MSDLTALIAKLKTFDTTRKKALATAAAGSKAQTLLSQAEPYVAVIEAATAQLTTLLTGGTPAPVVAPAPVVTPAPVGPTPVAAPTGDYALATTAAWPQANTYAATDGVCKVFEPAYGSTGPDIVFSKRVFKGVPDDYVVHVNFGSGRQIIFDRCIFLNPGTRDTLHVDTGSRVRVTNCLFLDLTNLPIGQQRGRAFYGYNARAIEFENNYYAGTGGAQVRYTADYTGLEKISWRFNRTDNVCGSNGSSGNGVGEYCQFLQLVGLVEGPNVEIAWNQVLNLPGQSRVEDNINLFECSGTAASPIRIHDNFIWGGYAADLNQANSGSGITTDGGGPNVPVRQLPHNIVVERNQFVGTNNAGMNIAAGYDVLYTDNDVVNSATVASGAKVAGAYSGVEVYRPAFDDGRSPTYSDAQFHNCRIVGNRVNFRPNPTDPVERGAVGPNSTKLKLGDSYNTYASTATYADEVAEFARWQKKLTDNKILLGPQA